jgi:hypothetical protein
LAVSFFIPVGHLTSGELWAYLIIVIAASIIVSRLTKMKRRKIKCPRCGTLVGRV